MIIFQIYTSKKVQNSQTASNNFFSKVYFRLLSESIAKKTFVINRKALRNFFKWCTHDYFQNIHPGNDSKQPKGFQEFFRRCIFYFFSESTPKKTFVISRKASKNFFSKGILMIIFKIYTPKKV